MSITVKHDPGARNDNRSIGSQCYTKAKAEDMLHKEPHVVSGYLKALRII